MKKLLCLSLAINLLAAGKWAIPHLLPSESRIIELGDVVFVGDSHTAFFPMDSLLHNPRIHNLGVGGLTTLPLIERLPAIIEAKPAKLFVQIGINDLGTGHVVDALLVHYHRIISIVHTKSPTTKIYVQSLFPVVAGNSIYPDPLLNSKVAETNRCLFQLCSTQGVIYIPLVLPPHSYRPDGVHLTVSAYQSWLRQIWPYL